MNFYCFNGEMISHLPLITPQNRGFRYGDGVFETIKIFQNKILLKEFHFERLLSSLSLLKIVVPNYLNPEKLSADILQLCQMNNCTNSARVRIAAYRDDKNRAGTIIEANALNEKVNSLNENGWTIDIYPFARKSMDAFANLKSANYLPYAMADLYAKEMGIDECLILNCENKIADASKANVFLVKENEVHTPALYQGCVNGVKRRFIIEQLKKEGIIVRQHEISEELLLNADEVFLTNAINDIRWVHSYKDKTYINLFVKEFYQKVFTTIYH